MRNSIFGSTNVAKQYHALRVEKRAHQNRVVRYGEAVCEVMEQSAEPAPNVLQELGIYNHATLFD